LAWDASGGQIQLAYGTVATDAQARIPASTFHIGSTSGSSAFWNGYIQSIAVYPTKLAPATTTVPALALLNGFVNNRLIDTFSGGLADIDTNNTKAAGYNWYVSPYFGASVPVAGDFTYGGGLVSIDASTNSSSYRARMATRGNTSSYFQGTIAGSVLTVNSLAGGSNNVAVGQVLAGANITGALTILSLGTGSGGAGTYNLSGSATVSSAQSFVGQSSVGLSTIAGSGGGYFEAKFAFNPANAPNNQTGGWPAFWIEDLAGLYSQNLTAGYSTSAHFSELDFFESIPSGTAGSPTSTLTMHDWTNTNGGGFGTNSQVQATPSFGSPTYTNVNTYAVVWIPSSKNSGLGSVSWYFNGTLVAGPLTYTSIGTSVPVSSNDFNGVFFIAESGNFVVLFDGGYQNAINIQSMQVWQ
jgi:hypothetical protein